MENDFNYDLENNPEYMLDMIRKDYKNYFRASYNLRRNFIFSLDAIYQCISQLENDDNHKDKEHNKAIYLDFCKKVNSESEINYGLINKDGYRVVQKRKKSPINIFKRWFFFYAIMFIGDKMDEFNSLKELYIKVRPALILKKEELKKMGMNHIVEADIWNYLKSEKWMTTTNLSLSELVNDILECDIDELDSYTKKELSKIERTANTDEILYL